MRYIKRQDTVGSYKSFQKKRFFRLFKNKKRIVLQQNEIKIYKNPFKRKKKNYRLIITLYTLLITVVVWIGLLLYLPNFKIQKINFEGLQIIKQEEIESKIRENFLQTGKFIPKDNFFLVKSKKIAKFLNIEFSLKSVDVKKKFPNTLQVNLVEKLSAIVYDNEKRYVLLGVSGEVIKDIRPVDESEFILKSLNPIIVATSTTSTEELTATSTINLELERIHIPNRELLADFNNYPILYDKRNLEITEKESILEKEFIEKIIEFYEGIKESRGINTLYMEMNHPLAGIKVTTDIDLFIWFQPNNNIQNQLNNLEIVLSDNNPKEYIDLRYNERVYWK